MNIFSKIWLRMAYIFDPIQAIFNGNFWQVFESKFKKYGSGRVLDLACGTGELIRHISPSYYLGIDLNFSYIQYARKHLSSENVFFKVGDIFGLKYDKMFDTAFFISAAHHFPSPDLKKLLISLKRNRIKKLILIDGYPTGILSRPLSWLDATLGGGKYFRSESGLVREMKKYFKIIKHGTFNSKRSFYCYPYVIAS